MSLKNVLLLFLGVVVLVVLWKLVGLVRYEMRGNYHSDVGIYMAVGRGILNGLAPYRELFETKPPGVFLLAALSLQIVGTPALYLFIGALLIGLIPVWVMVPFVKNARRQYLRLAFAFLFGVVLAFYTANKAGQGLSESFGAFFALGAVAVAALRREKFSWPVMIAFGLLTLLATGIKEPFLISIIGGALIVSPSFTSMKRLAIPMAGAVGAGIVALLALGMLRDYVGIFLRHMLFHQIIEPWGVLHEPLWLRTIDLPRLWLAMQAYSYVFPWLVAALWIGTLVIFIQQRGRWLGLGQWALGTWLMTLSVGISGDFYGHHFAFIVPVLAAFFFVCMRESRVLESIPYGDYAIGAWLMLLVIKPVFLTPIGAPYPARDWHAWVAERTKAAAVIDDVLDGCKIDRYLLLINVNDGIYAYTTHSPMGPVFTQYARFMGGLPLFFEQFEKQYATAPIAVGKYNEAHPLIDEESADNFDRDFTETDIPACAGENFVQPFPYHVLFRRNAAWN